MTTKTFDSVKLMRELRDQLSKEMEGMTAEERMRYIRDKAMSTSIGRAMILERDRASTSKQEGAQDSLPDPC